MRSLPLHAEPPKTPPLRPFVKAELSDGTSVEGRLDYFDDGTYRLITRQGLRTFKEADVADIEFVILHRARAEKPLDPQVALLVKRFTRSSKGPEGHRRAYDPRLIARLAAQGDVVIEPLIDATAKDQARYQGVGRVFREMGPKIHTALVEAVRNDDRGSTHRTVYWTFVETGVSCAPLMGRLLGDDDPRIRKLAMDVLYGLATTSGIALPPELDEPLIRAFADPEQTVREQAPLILGRIGFSSRRTLPALLETLDSPKFADIRMKSVIALGDLARDLKAGDEDLQQIVKKLATRAEDDTNAVVRNYSCLYLGQLGSKASSALPALRHAADDKVASVRKSAAEAVKMIDGK